MTYNPNSRRNFLKTISTSTLLSTTSVPVFASSIEDKTDDKSDLENGKEKYSPSVKPLVKFQDGPSSTLFDTISFSGNRLLSGISEGEVSKEMQVVTGDAPIGETISWGIPFEINPSILYLKEEAVDIQFTPVKGNWIVFLHTSDRLPLKKEDSGFYEKPFSGIGHLNEHVASYVILYSDGSELSGYYRSNHLQSNHTGRGC